MTAPQLPDQEARMRAWGSPNCVVVEASAGTGKTFLLVQRALWFLFYRGATVDRILALTFGEKAAREMAKRLRDVLQSILSAPSLEKLPPELKLMSPPGSLADLKGKAREALESFPRAHISTIHAFCADLLRLYPAEVGVDPGFAVDEGRAFEEFVSAEWDQFLAHELGPDAPRAAHWGRLLQRVRLENVGELAQALAGFRVDLDRILAGRGPDKAPGGEVQRWLADIAEGAGRLKDEVAEAAPRARKPGEFLGALAEAAGSLLAGKGVPESAAQVLEKGCTWPDALGAEDRAAGLRLEKFGGYLRLVRDEGLIRDTLEVLRPFAVRVRESMLRSGFVPYEGLLSLTRDLLRDSFPVREAVKARFDAVLVDEAQDVDPLQLEIILYVAEREGRQARDWREAVLHRGKLFIVGDPKQSIYGFRGADLTAFQTVLERAAGDGAERVTLTTSMRSHTSIIGMVNGVGDGLFGGGEIGYSGLAVNPAREESAPRPRVGVIEVVAGEEGLARAEAQAVARVAAGLVKEGVPQRNIAILFHVRTYLTRYAAALRRAGLNAVAEVEGGFYSRPEVVDILGAFRLVADPGSRLALACVLRGQFGALSDVQLARWFRAWKGPAGRSPWAEMARTAREAGLPDRLGALFAALGRLADTLPLLPGRAWVEGMWTELALDAVAARMERPGAADAVNVLRRFLGDLLETRGISGTIRTLDSCYRAVQEGENPAVNPPAMPVAREREAVRLLTVHQAKGLEFPVVILGGTGAQPRTDRYTETGFSEDWSSGLRGAVLTSKVSREALMTLEEAWIRARKRERALEEKNRLLYVALTRARDVLLVVKSAKAGSSTVAGRFLAPIIGKLAPDAGLAVPEPVPSRPAARPAPPPDAAAAEEGAAARGAPLPAEPELATPSDFGLERTALPGYEAAVPGAESHDLLLGEVCHRVLEAVDFRSPPGNLNPQVERALGSLVVPPRMRERLGADAHALLRRFLGSGAAGELARAEILGREVPLLAAVDGRPVNARADLVFRLDGKLLVGDYKSGASPRPDPATARAYSGAVSAALGEPAEFVLISLASGKFVVSR